jgi:GNAT superfamily N-acetyltransferase
MGSEVRIRYAGAEHSERVARLVLALFAEIGHEMPAADAHRAARQLLTGGDRHYVALLAETNDGAEPVGVLTLAESCATYAGGRFGIIQEFYVAPEFRSRGVGSELLRAAQTHANQQAWHRLEVTAPFGDRFLRSVGFYRKNGFTDSGPRLNLKPRA